jgi:hypothetical protein
MFISDYLFNNSEDGVPVVANWENDVNDVVLESCGLDVDPSGYRVVYHKMPANANKSGRDRFYIGASYLKNRLETLRCAGFDAPMTKKALNMLDKKRLKRFS